MRASLPLLAAAVLAATACGSEPPTSPDAPEALYGHGVARESAQLHAALAPLRKMTARFHDIEAAMAAGWSVPITPCLENPGVGAMGVHYANLALFDADAELLAPEALIYEPRRNGDLRLVGIEYIIPFSEVPATADPPELLGHEFHPVEGAGIWGLHIWLWRHNPEGLFADWNPKVSCAFAG